MVELIIVGTKDSAFGNKVAPARTNPSLSISSVLALLPYQLYSAAAAVKTPAPNSPPPISNNHLRGLNNFCPTCCLSKPTINLAAAVKISF